MSFKDKYRAEMQNVRPGARLICATGQKMAAKKAAAGKTRRIRNSALAVACLALALGLPAVCQTGDADEPAAAGGAAPTQSRLYAPGPTNVRFDENKLRLPLPVETSHPVADRSLAADGRSLSLTAEELARSEVCAAYLPPTLPEDMRLAAATLYLPRASAQTPFAPGDSLLVRYTDGRFDYLTVRISPYTAADAPRLAEADRPETWDEALYDLPLSASIPADMWQQVTDPIFPAQDITAEIVQRLAGESDQNARYLRFGVKAGDMLLEYTAHTPDIAGLWQAISETPALQ